MVYDRIVVLNAVMVGADNSLPEEDCWLLTEKYADELPIHKQKKWSYCHPLHPQIMYPRQWQKATPKTVCFRARQFSKFMRHIFDTTGRILYSKKARYTYKYALFGLLAMYTLYFCVWTFKFHNS